MTTDCSLEMMETRGQWAYEMKGGKKCSAWVLHPAKYLSNIEAHSETHKNGKQSLLAVTTTLKEVLKEKGQGQAGIWTTQKIKNKH